MQYDIDRRAVNHGIRTANFKGKGAHLQLFPTVVTHKANLQFYLAKAGTYKIEMYDATGVLVNVVASGQAKANHSLNTAIDASKHPSGVYVVKLITGSEVITQRLVIQR